MIAGVIGIIVDRRCKKADQSQGDLILADNGR